MPRPTPSPFVRALAALKGALAELNVSWYLFGAQAALIYGSSRATADLDLTVHLGQVTSRQLAAHLRSSGFRLRFKNVKFVDQTRVLPVVHETTDIAADLVIAGPGLEQLFLERSVQRKVGSVVLPVARLEDIVAMKVLAGRAKDRDDIVDILCANLKGWISRSFGQRSSNLKKRWAKTTCCVRLRACLPKPKEGLPPRCLVRGFGRRSGPRSRSALRDVNHKHTARLVA